MALFAFFFLLWFCLFLPVGRITFILPGMTQIYVCRKFEFHSESLQILKGMIPEGVFYYTWVPLLSGILLGPPAAFVSLVFPQLDTAVDLGTRRERCADTWKSFLVFYVDSAGLEKSLVSVRNKGPDL